MPKMRIPPGAQPPSMMDLAPSPMMVAGEGGGLLAKLMGLLKSEPKGVNPTQSLAEELQKLADQWESPLKDTAVTLPDNVSKLHPNQLPPDDLLEHLKQVLGLK